MISRFLMIFIFVSFTFTSLQSQISSWIKHIDPSGLADQIHSLSTTAEVEVSDGLTYTTESVFHDQQRAVFKRIYSDRSVTSGIDGKYLWYYDGEKESEAPQFYQGYILGHQMHAQLLFFNKLQSDISAIRDTLFDHKVCRFTSAKAPNGNTFFLFFDKLPIALIIDPPDQKNIIMKLSNYDKVNEFVLPYSIEIDDGERIFNYQFQTISINKGNINEYRAPFDQLTNEQQLLRLHRQGMDAHLWEDAEAIKQTQADTIMLVNAGEVSFLASSVMDDIMSSRDYTIYDDLIRPIIKVSDDGKMGWVTVQIFAKGFRFDDQRKPTIPFQFTCAWISLFEKIEGRWRMIGNVSNFTDN